MQRPRIKLTGRRTGRRMDGSGRQGKTNALRKRFRSFPEVDRWTDVLQTGSCFSPVYQYIDRPINFQIGGRPIDQSIDQSLIRSMRWMPARRHSRLCSRSSEGLLRRPWGVDRLCRACELLVIHIIFEGSLRGVHMSVDYHSDVMRTSFAGPLYII